MREVCNSIPGDCTDDVCSYGLKSALCVLDKTPYVRVSNHPNAVANGIYSPVGNCDVLLYGNDQGAIWIGWENPNNVVMEWYSHEKK